LPDSLLSRFDLVYVVRDQTTEEIDRRIATQVLRQCGMRGGAEGRRRGVEEIHSSILERRAAADKENTQQAAKVFEDTMPVAEGEDAEQVVTVDFLQKYIRFAKRYKPILSPEAQAAVADKYVDMRMRFQSGFADLNAAQEGNPDRKPRLAVTTRTLEALIRLATAHAKLKLRKDHVLEEDVLEAYRLMLAAREEEVPVPPGADAPIEGDDDGADDGDEDPRGPRGKKRQREEAAEGEGEAASSTAIVAARFDTLRLLVARCFSKKKSNSIGRGELLEMVNAELAPGEPQFVQDEYDAGLLRLEEENKIMLEEASDEVFHVS